MSRWLSLVQFSAEKGVSLSTLRRQIKAKTLEYRLEKGKYFVLDGGRSEVPNSEDEVQRLREMNKKLEKEYLKAQREIAELKTLIAIYEEKLPDLLHY